MVGVWGMGQGWLCVSGGSAWLDSVISPTPHCLPAQPHSTPLSPPQPRPGADAHALHRHELEQFHTSHEAAVEAQHQRLALWAIEAEGRRDIAAEQGSAAGALWAEWSTAAALSQAQRQWWLEQQREGRPAPLRPGQPPMLHCVGKGWESPFTAA